MKSESPQTKAKGSKTTDKNPEKKCSGDENRTFRSLFDSLGPDSSEQIDSNELKQRIANSGLREDDPRLDHFYHVLGIHPGKLSFEHFCNAIGGSAVLIDKCLKGKLVIPEFDKFCREIDELYKTVAKNKLGQVADYIPQLANISPNKFGVSICTVDGQRYSVGDCHETFSIQSTSKPVNYCLALEDHGTEKVHRHVGREPSGHSFNEITLDGRRRPHNPMINAGAIMCASLVQSELNPAERFDFVTPGC